MVKLHKHQDVCAIDRETIVWGNGLFKKEGVMFDDEYRIEMLEGLERKLRKRVKVLTIACIVNTVTFIGIILLISRVLGID